MLVSHVPMNVVLTDSTNQVAPSKYHPTFEGRITRDTVSFTGKSDFNIRLEPEIRDAVIDGVKYGTSGYRGIYVPEGQQVDYSKLRDKPFDKDIVRTITQAVSLHLAKDLKPGPKTIMIGGDTREATKNFSPEIIEQLLDNGVNVCYPKGSKLDGLNNFKDTKNPKCLEYPVKNVPTPLLALATKEKAADFAVLLTASHNPWDYAGYNFVTPDGAIAPPQVLEKLGNHIMALDKNPHISAKVSDTKGKLTTFDPYKIYKDHLDKTVTIDWEAIKNANMFISYDAISGTGADYFPKLLKDHGVKIKKNNNTYQESGPNPTAKNLTKVSEQVVNAKHANDLRIGLATDGDSDRFGVIDEKGNFIAVNDVLLLTAYHLIKNRNAAEAGNTIVRSHATSAQLDALVEKHGIKVIQTPVGFKHVGKQMEHRMGTNEVSILGGEESGGLTIKDHIPEKDGFIALLMMLELVAKEKKPLSEILTQVKADLPYKYKSERLDIKFDTTQQKLDFVNAFNEYAKGGDIIPGLKVDVSKTAEVNNEIKSLNGGKDDGTKIYFDDGSSILVRKSGTENLARFYMDIRGNTLEEAEKKVEALSKMAKGVADQVKQ